MTIDFCTYFDSAYLCKAIVCHHTLMLNTKARLFVLCLDTAVEKIVSCWSNAVIVRLSEIESYQPALLGLKHRRQMKEYYATITPILPLFVFDKFGIDLLFYTDADMAFWSNAVEIAHIMGNHSLLVTPHENPIAVAGGAGYFNVGILGYRNDTNCRKFLKWWEERCLEWCEWRTMPDGRIADQGYLDILHMDPACFKGVLADPEPGINLGPWNLALHHTCHNECAKIILDNKYNLICYHYHGYKNINGTCVNNTGWEVSEWNMNNIYQPYHDMLVRVQGSFKI